MDNKIMGGINVPLKEEGGKGRGRPSHSSASRRILPPAYRQAGQRERCGLQRNVIHPAEVYILMDSSVPFWLAWHMQRSHSEKPRFLSHELKKCYASFYGLQIADNELYQK
ncbi:hypothetical protein A8C56_11320 [Niabella ginsenosidivorans]|uniref:Uncharacterized protein n=1 Tax=Niabella ginsenosidivorans TaxID=1176587 RepID=A0A1A9I354_9BACT|nr:hypothetical protein A8C56_11320 [Niabella ginsenosidivorans]